MNKPKDRKHYKVFSIYVGKRSYKQNLKKLVQLSESTGKSQSELVHLALEYFFKFAPIGSLFDDDSYANYLFNLMLESYRRDKSAYVTWYDDPSGGGKTSFQQILKALDNLKQKGFISFIISDNKDERRFISARLSEDGYLWHEFIKGFNVSI